MRHMPTILLLLSFPAGILGYALGVRVMQSLPLGEDTRGFLVLFVPLFVAGLVMLPFLIPFFDRKAKKDLAEYARSREAAAEPAADEPDREPE
jgi:hypothetical protein